MKNFLVIDDYSTCAIWDSLILRAMLSLPTKPKGWPRPENTNPEGEWLLSYGMYPMATPDAYRKAGIQKPQVEELPVIFCLVNGAIVSRRNNVTADHAADFIRENLS